MLNNNIEKLDNETWLPVVGFESLYWVSDKGRVSNGRIIMKTYTINSGYECIDFRVLGEKSKHLVHRLVARAFIPNTESLREVNHVDEDKRNNYATNLEWVTSSQNKRHSMASGTYGVLYTAKNTLGKKHFSTASRFHNVGWDKSRNKWVACVRHNGVNYYHKRFDSEEEAALHVNWILDTLKLTDRPKNIVEMPND